MDTAHAEEPTFCKIELDLDRIDPFDLRSTPHLDTGA